MKRAAPNAARRVGGRITLSELRACNVQAAARALIFHAPTPRLIPSCLLMVLTFHALFTFLTTGVVLCVAVVHYPLFAKVGQQAWGAYHVAHMRTIGPLIAPLMLGEIITAVLLLTPGASGAVPWQAWPGAGLLAVCWIATFAFAVPAHNRLATGLDPAAFQSLLRWNWVRAIAWCARSALVAWIMLTR